MSDRHQDWPARLRFHPSAFIAPGAVVVGEVTLGARASIWFNTVVRGDSAAIEVGEDSNVQDNSTVHVDEGSPTIIGPRVTVGHRAIVHGCMIESDCLIGMGAVILSGARIGAGSLVGATALVKENQVIPPGSLVLGTPARVIGPVGDTHRAAIREGAKHYVALSRAYLGKGFARPFPSPDSTVGVNDVSSGPMSFAEWGRCLALLSEAPASVAAQLAAHGAARFGARPGEGRWSALEVLAHLRDADEAVYLPRLHTMLTESFAPIADVDLLGRERVTSYSALDAADVLEQWRAARERLVIALAPLGRADWARVGLHSLRGPFPLGDMVRAWVEHDLSHRRQLGLALGNPA
ncbi:MAG: DinB family protein [Candidatus Eisenbacteria bacterium]